MAFITLTTDFGNKDHYIPSVKGAIYSLHPTAIIVDISHEIEPFNITETAYILKNTYKNFPKGTIHIVGVDADLTPENNHIAIELDEQYFICANNGIMSLIISEKRPSKIVNINIHNRTQTNFSVLDAFINCACHIARGGALEVIGNPINNIKELTELQPIINPEKNIITGSVIYIDNYGNVITNITKQLITDIGNGRPFEIKASRYTFKKIFNSYSDIIDYNIPPENRSQPGDKMALINGNQYLEIAIYKSNLNTVGGASTLLGLSYRDMITIQFTN